MTYYFYEGRYGKQSLDKLEIHIPLLVAICNHMLLCSNVLCCVYSLLAYFVMTILTSSSKLVNHL